MKKDEIVKVSKETHELLKEIKNKTGKNIKFVVAIAVKQWWEREVVVERK